MNSILSRGATLLSDPSVDIEAGHALPILGESQGRAIAGSLIPVMASAAGNDDARSPPKNPKNPDGMQ